MAPGIEQELFVHPDRISMQLICPICTNVLENPVMTPSEHLFCEDELIEWLTRSCYCPITKAVLDPSTIRPAGRIIMNMLSELQRYCLNKSEGCSWTGPSSDLASHTKTCKHKSKDDLMKEINEKESIIKQLGLKLSECEKKNDDLKRENQKLSSRCEQYITRIRVYEAFAEGGKNFNESSDLVSDAKASKALNHSSNMGSKIANLSLNAENVDDGGGAGSVNREKSALQKICRLRKLESFKDDE